MHADSISKVQAVAFALLFLIQECQFSHTFLCVCVYIGATEMKQQVAICTLLNYCYSRTGVCSKCVLILNVTEGEEGVT